MYTVIRNKETSKVYIFSENEKNDMNKLTAGEYSVRKFKSLNSLTSYLNALIETHNKDFNDSSVDFQPDSAEVPAKSANYTKQDLLIAGKISPSILLRYIKIKGWTQFPCKTDNVLIYRFTRGGEIIQVNIPATRDLKGYQISMIKAIEVIALAEGVSVDHILNAIIDPFVKEDELPELQSMGEVSIYTDGSAMTGKMATTGYGFVVIQNDKIICKDCGKVCELSKNNISGELYAVIRSLEFCVANGIKKVHIFYDFEGVKTYFEQPPAKNAPSNRKVYYEAVQKIKKTNNLKLLFSHVKAHNGNRYNGIADKLARKGCSIR